MTFSNASLAPTSLPVPALTSSMNLTAARTSSGRKGNGQTVSLPGRCSESLASAFCRSRSEVLFNRFSISSSGARRCQARRLLWKASLRRCSCSISASGPRRCQARRLLWKASLQRWVATRSGGGGIWMVGCGLVRVLVLRKRQRERQEEKGEGEMEGEKSREKAKAKEETNQIKSNQTKPNRSPYTSIRAPTRFHRRRCSCS